VIYCIYGSCFSLMLGFAQIPYAASKAGMFLELFAHEHPTKKFADYSLLFMGFFTCIFCFVDLAIVIEGMMTTTIITMFLSNSLSLVYHRWTQPDCHRPYKMPLYPLPVIVQVVMFSFIFLTSDNWIFTGGNPLLELGLLFLLVGSFVFLIQSKKLGEWPFDTHVLFDDPLKLTTATMTSTTSSVEGHVGGEKTTDTNEVGGKVEKTRKTMTKKNNGGEYMDVQTSTEGSISGDMKFGEEKDSQTQSKTSLSSLENEAQ